MSNDLGNKEVMARNLQRYMTIHRMMRKDLAAMVGVPYTTVCDWVNANTYPRIDKIEKMAMIFGISKADLIETKKPDTVSDAELTQEEHKFFTMYRKLTPEQKGIIETLAKTLHNTS